MVREVVGRAELLAWYDRSKRDLAWRRTRDPYRIWLAEVMLQQTRVEAAAPYFDRFVAALPSLAALAAAPLDQVLGLWSGLGYYRRARSLHRAAQLCVERHGGEVPGDPDEFGALPGVGPYTRAAVMSIGFGVPLAVVDGNVLRVLARRHGLPGHPRSPELVKAVAGLAEGMIQGERPGDLNQALMELGATVCVSRGPRCGECPWRQGCVAAASGEPERWPGKAPRAVPRQVLWHAAVVERGGRLLLGRRGAEARLAGMWELPWTDGGLEELAARFAVRLQPQPELGRIHHAIVDDRITVVLHAARGTAAAAGSRFAWKAPSEIATLPMASVWSKALRRIQEQRLQPALWPAELPRAESLSAELSRPADVRRGRG